MRLSRRQLESDRKAARIGHGVDLGLIHNAAHLQGWGKFLYTTGNYLNIDIIELLRLESSWVKI
jgi:hypothetical protein